MNNPNIIYLKAQNQLIKIVERKLEWFFEELVEFINHEDEDLFDANL